MLVTGLVYLLNISALLTFFSIFGIYFDNAYIGKDKFIIIWGTVFYVITYFVLYFGVWSEKKEYGKTYDWGIFGTLLFYPIIVFIVQVVIMAPAIYWVYEKIFI